MEWMLYGATGYTGQNLATEAVRQGLRPVLAGRNPGALRHLAERLGCRWRAFEVSAVKAQHSILAGMRLVLNAAGPFSQTADPLVDACLSMRCHYLDVTGEWNVIEAIAHRHAEAISVGAILMPAVGFDVVPSDCLALWLAERLPSAKLLQIAFTADRAMSRGTAKTMIEGLLRGGRVRKNGRITAVPIGHKTRVIPFSNRPRKAVCLPWGDVASAWYTTGIGNIEVYAALSGWQIAALRVLRGFIGKGLTKDENSGELTAKACWLRDCLWRILDRHFPNPRDTEDEASQAYFWGQVCDRTSGKTCEASLTTPGGYRLTVQTALAAVRQILQDPPSPGFWTPARAFGHDFIRRFDRVIWHGLSHHTSAYVERTAGPI